MTGNWLATIPKVPFLEGFPLLHGRNRRRWSPKSAFGQCQCVRGTQPPCSEIVAHSLSSHGSFNKQKGCLWKSQRRFQTIRMLMLIIGKPQSFMTTNGGFPSVFTKWVPVLLQHPGCKGRRMENDGKPFLIQKTSNREMFLMEWGPNKNPFPESWPSRHHSHEKIRVHRDPIMALSWDTITFWDRGTSGLWFWPFAWSRLGRKLKTLVEYLKWVFDEAWSIGAEWVLYITI